MPGPLSGVEAITPAIEETKRQLFGPFRFARWARLAVVSMLTGELTGGGWGGGNYNFNLPTRSGSGRHESDLTSLAFPLPDRIMEFLPLILAGVLALILFFLLFIYISSLFRFILFDSILYNRCEIRESWRRYKAQGSSYFLWQIGFALVTLGILAAVLGLPLAWAWSAGVFREPGRHVLLLILGGIGLLLLFFAILLVSALAGLFAKDFVVPLMALENLGVLDGWRKFFPMLGIEKGAYTIYVLMKIVLAVGSAILFAIIDFVVLFMLMIPLGLVGVVAVLAGAAAGLTWNPVTIGIAVLAGLAALALLIFVMALVSVPAMVFFQSYTLYFFGSRYPQLGAHLALPKVPALSSGALPAAVAPSPAT